MKRRLISMVLVLVLAFAFTSAAFAKGTEVSADWANFRNSEVNMALTHAKTPKEPETTVLKWAKRLGSGWSANPSVQIIADNALIVMSGKVLYKLDLQSGEIVQQADMAAAPNFGYTPATYAAGLIFCPLSGGTVQAFDAKTLEAQWTFKDEKGGQSLSPITYSDGRIYTGFWNGEAKDANYVCVNVEDGSLVWSKTVTGGFYWAGSAVVGDTLIVGTDDGESGYAGTSRIFTLKKATGEVITEMPLVGCGDQRSAIAYSAEKGRIYCTAKNGYLCSAAFDAQTGKLSELKTSKQASQCTSTPVVYGNQVYFSCGSGVVQGSGGNGNFVVADADTLAQLYVVPLSAYPQGSVLVSDAYLQETGKLYCYSTYNGLPGGLTLIKVDPSKNSADGAEAVEIYDANGYANYCITSPICGTDGTIYYKNDSGNVLAVGSNEAYLTALTADAGAASEEFKASAETVEWVVPVGTQSVTFRPTPCEGGTVTVDGKEAGSAAVLAEGKATVQIAVTKGTDTRTYTVSVREIYTDATLGELRVNEANSYSGKPLALSPEFAPETRYYTMLSVGASRTFENVWPTAANEKATVAVFPLNNVKVADRDKDADTGAIKVTATNSNHNRYAIYFDDDSKPMAIRIVVTAENGDKEDYVLVLSKAAAAEAGSTLLEQIKEADEAAAIAAVNQAAADAVAEKINAIGTVTLASKNAIKAAQEAYNGLSDEQKALVSNYAVLTAAEETLKRIKAEATANPIKVFVTISNKGEVVLFRKSITVTDVNDNGLFDVDDALYAAHEAAYAGGAAAGYQSGPTPVYEGLSIFKLWGNTEGSYSYWRNNGFCWSLEDALTEGDDLTAYVFTDTQNFTDAYSYFEKQEYAADAAASLTVKLYAMSGYDANWAPLFSLHAGAEVQLYDAQGRLLREGYTVTDNKDGSYTVTVAAEGDYYLVATDADPLTVPAVSSLKVNAAPVVRDNPGTSDAPQAAVFATATLVCLMGFALLFYRKKRADGNR